MGSVAALWRATFSPFFSFDAGGSVGRVGEGVKSAVFVCVRVYVCVCVNAVASLELRERCTGH